MTTTLIDRPPPIERSRLEMDGVFIRCVSHDPLGASWTQQTLIRRPLATPLSAMMDRFCRSITRDVVPGCFFAQQPTIARRTRRYVLIHQRVGYDA